MKGQMFLIGTLVVVLVLVLIKTTLNVTDIIESKRFLESGLEKEVFQNFRDETVNAAIFSMNQSTNITGNVNSFIHFSKSALATRDMSLGGVVVQTVHASPSASVDTRMNISVINFLPVPLDFINLNFTASGTANTTYNNVPSGFTIETNYTFNTASNTNYTLYIAYGSPIDKIVQNITIPIELGKSKYIAFYDIRLESSRLEQKDRLIKTFEIP